VDIKVSLELSFGIGYRKEHRQECLSYNEPKTETPRPEPGRSNQQGYCTTTVVEIKLEISGRGEKSQKPHPCKKQNRKDPDKVGTGGPPKGVFRN
jgi:hypothetical protein